MGPTDPKLGAEKSECVGITSSVMSYLLEVNTGCAASGKANLCLTFRWRSLTEAMVSVQLG